MGRGSLCEMLLAKWTNQVTNSLQTLQNVTSRAHP